MSYNYLDGKQRVLNILKKSIKVIEKDSIPKQDSEWTYDNALECWISAVFVDLRDSTKFFNDADSVVVTKTLRAYASEVIEILHSSDLVREIGVRGDGIYAIFSTPKKNDISKVFGLVCYINTYMNMLNKLLQQEGFDTLRAGIGMASSKDLIAKVGRKGTGINDKIWIGECVAEADRLSGITNKGAYNRTKPIAISICVYDNLKDVDSKSAELMKRDYNHNCYFGDVIITDFNDWIDSGMLI